MTDAEVALMALREARARCERMLGFAIQRYVRSSGREEEIAELRVMFAQLNAAIARRIPEQPEPADTIHMFSIFGVLG